MLTVVRHTCTSIESTESELVRVFEKLKKSGEKEYFLAFPNTMNTMKTQYVGSVSQKS